MGTKIKSEDNLGPVKQEINRLIAKGWIEYRKYNLNTAQDYAGNILKTAKQNNYPRGILIAYYLYGLINASLNRYDLAFENYFAGLKAVVNTNDKDSISLAYENIGRCYGQLENYAKAIEFFKQSLELKKSLSVYNNIGECYLRMEQLNLAYEYLFEAYSKLNGKPGLIKDNGFLYSDICLNLSQVYIGSNDPEKARKVLEEVFQLDVILDDMKIRCALYSALGTTYTLLKQFNTADEYFQQAIQTATKYDVKEVLYECYRSYSKYFSTLGNYEEAIKQNSKYLQIRDVLFSNEITNKVLSISEHHAKEIKKIENSRREIEKGKQEIESKLRQLQAIYASVNGIGRVGIFSEKMKNIMKMVDFFHDDRAVPVLIEGESGTGKEIVARMIHYKNSIDSSPFITLNCSAISESLFESELFGYVEGAFTGANTKGRAGKFELAQGGTLFLDEISDLPLDLQPKLLRALQQREIYRVGGNESIKLDIRIIAATNKDLRQ